MFQVKFRQCSQEAEDGQMHNCLDLVKIKVGKMINRVSILPFHLEDKLKKLYCGFCLNYKI